MYVVWVGNGVGRFIDPLVVFPPPHKCGGFLTINDYINLDDGRHGITAKLPYIDMANGIRLVRIIGDSHNIGGGAVTRGSDGVCWGLQQNKALTHRGVFDRQVVDELVRNGDHLGRGVIESSAKVSRKII